MHVRLLTLILYYKLPWGRTENERIEKFFKKKCWCPKSWRLIDDKKCHDNSVEKKAHPVGLRSSLAAHYEKVFWAATLLLKLRLNFQRLTHKACKFHYLVKFQHMICILIDWTLNLLSAWFFSRRRRFEMTTTMINLIGDFPCLVCLLLFAVLTWLFTFQYSFSASSTKWKAKKNIHRASVRFRLLDRDFGTVVDTTRVREFPVSGVSQNSRSCSWQIKIRFLKTFLDFS